MKNSHTARTAAALCCPLFLSALSAFAAPSLADLEDLALAPNSYYNGADGAGGFNSGGARFNNNYDPTFDSWAGFSYSDTTDPTTPGFGNQYSSAAGQGAGGSANYAVAYNDSFSTTPTITLPAGQDRPLSIAIDNTTYAALSIRDGDQFAKKFGGPTGNDPDYFLLTITAYDAASAPLGSVGFYLADYRFADNAQDYIVTNWTTVDLSSFGAGVSSLQFSFTSSDVSFGFINTPTYAALDNLAVVPEPSAAGLLALAALGGAAARWRRGRPVKAS